MFQNPSFSVNRRGLSGDSEPRSQSFRVLRMSGDGCLVGTRFDYPCRSVFVVVGEFLSRYLKRDALCLTGLELHASEGLQLFDGPLNPGLFSSYLELHHLFVRPWPCVGDLHAGSECPVPLDLGGLQVQAAVVKGGVAEAEPEWEGGFGVVLLQ